MKHGSKGILLAKPTCNLWNKTDTLLDVALIHEDNQPATLIRIATKNPEYANFNIGQYIRGNIWIQANIYALNQ